MIGRRRICFALPSLAGGGAERAAVQILNGLDANRWERWLYLFRKEGPYLADVSPSIQVAGGGSASRLGRWRALRRFIRSTRPDLVVSFLSYFTVLSAVRAAGVGARVAFNQQTPMSAFLSDSDYPWAARAWLRRLFVATARVGYAAADLIVATSRGVADDVVMSFGVGAERVRIVHNPVDIPAIGAAAAEPIDAEYAAAWIHPVIVAAGRLSEAKNYPLLIDALAIVRQRVPARLFILGQGEQESRLRDLAVARGLGDEVRFLGFQANPWKYIARADVLALTSRYEGFGNVLVEAMACGVSVVATSSPGTREIVSAGEDGLLVERHEPAAVAAALERVLTDDALRGRMSAATRSHAQRFSLPSIAAAYDRLFAEALA